MTAAASPGAARNELPPELLRIPDAANAAILLGQLLGFAGLLAAAQAVSAWAVPLVGVAFAVWMSAVYAAIHEAEHGVLFSNPRANTAGGVVLSALLPAPYHLIRQTHAGHHLRNRSDDESFDLWMPGESPAWKRVQWYGILSGAFFGVVVLSNLIVVCLPWLMRPSTYGFDRPSRAALASLNPDHRFVMAAEGAANIALHAAILIGTGLPLWRYAVLYACHGVLWSALQYVYHHGTERHVVRGARNVWFLPGVDHLWMNHHWHRVHHAFPTVSWIHLARLGRENAGGHAAEPREWAPARYAKMWLGPRKAEERVDNRYAGEVMR